MAATQVADVVIPEIFDAYTQQETEEKTRLVQSGVLVKNPLVDQKLAGGGQTFNVPSFQDLANVDDNVSGDDIADIQTLVAGGGTTLAAQNDARPQKISSSTEVLVRLERNQSWSSMDLAGDLIMGDPQAAIISRVSTYWARRLQAAFVSTINGILADNDANDSGDFTNDISGGAFIDGVTNFSAEALLDAQLTMGDSGSNLAVVMVHSVVLNRMKKNNLIDFIPDARGEVKIPTFQGLEVIEDDGLPFTGNIYDSWLFARGAAPWGSASPETPSETHRQPLAGNGGGQEILTTRVAWAIHLIGLAFTGNGFANGGPANTTGTAPLNAAASWNRVYPDRKQIGFARLITREA